MLSSAPTVRIEKPSPMAFYGEPDMTDDYDRGQRDGLRMAFTILAAEEAKWFAVLGESRS